MTTRHLIKAAMGIAALLLPAAGANAAFIYSTTVSVANSPVLPSPPGVVSNSFAIGNGNTLTFIGSSIPSSAPADPTVPGGADINFGTIRFDPASDNSDNTDFNVNYNFQVTITDLVTNTSQIVNFTGNLTGTASGNENNSGASINSSLTSSGVSPTMLDFGNGNVYILTDKGGVGPGSSGVGITDGKLQGNVSMQAVPEPSSVALLTIGGLAFGLTARRRMAKRNAE